jgi:hypothetical protein
VTTSLITVKSWNALLRMLMVCIFGYLKSVLRHKHLILDTYYLNTRYLRQQGYDDLLMVFSESQMGLRAKMFAKHWARGQLSSWYVTLELGRLHTQFKIKTTDRQIYTHTHKHAPHMQWPVRCKTLLNLLSPLTDIMINFTLEQTMKTQKGSRGIITTLYVILTLSLPN